MKLSFEEIKRYIKNTLQDIQAVYSEKGTEPFKKPAGIAIVLILASFFFYRSSSSGLLDAQDKLKWIESIKDYYNEYVSSKQTIKNYSSNLPAWKEKEEYLSYMLTSIATKNQITFSSVETQKEMPFDRIYYVTKEVRFTTTYEKLIKFLSEIETSELFIEISQINITKKESTSQLGLVEVDLIVGTIFINL